MNARIILLLLAVCLPGDLSAGLLSFGSPPRRVIKDALRSDLDKSELGLVNYSLSLKGLRRESQDSDGRRVHIITYRAISIVERGNSWIAEGKRQSHSGRLLIFRKDRKWYRIREDS
ncbi:MAG TPA: hypothetical protein DCR55_16150 [Lentisphaeria bacterium]|nr:hypothetical protein [Lentisphaeria bacterium]